MQARGILLFLRSGTRSAETWMRARGILSFLCAEPWMQVRGILSFLRGEPGTTAT